MTCDNVQGLVVFLSPHLDDVVASCGGTISHLACIGTEVEVVTVFAGSPTDELSEFAASLHATWRLPYDAPAWRRDENRRALSDLGAGSICLSFQDAIYRRPGRGQSCLYASKDQLFSGNWQNESGLLGALVDGLESVLAERNWSVLCVPAGVGGHVDHLLVRTAAQSACARMESRIVFYEDLPYALDPAACGKALTELGSGPVLHLVVPLTEPRIRAKDRAMRLYASQSTRVAGELGLPVNDVIEYASAVSDRGTAPYAERFWACCPAALDSLRRVLQMR